MTTPSTAATQSRHPNPTVAAGPRAQGGHRAPHDRIDEFPCPHTPESTFPESTVLAATAMLRCAEDLCESARKLLSPFSSDAANQAGAARDAAVAASNAADGLQWN